MGYVLSVYSKSAYKEFLLPAIDNADYALSLSRELFGLAEDRKLELEIVNGLWKFTIPASNTGSYSMVYTDRRESAFEKTIKNKDIFSLSLGTGEQITIIVKVTDQFLQVYEKFSLQDVEEIGIGSKADNALCYDYMHVVSGRHAVLRRSASGWMLEDRSANGVFINAKRVMGSKQLEFGDVINIFGLQIVYLKDYVAVSTGAEGLAISPGVLRQYIEMKGGKNTQEKNMSAVQGEGDKTLRLFRRSPRYLPKLEADRVDIDEPPALKEDNQQPLFLSIGPSLTMAFPMLLGCTLAIYSTKASGRSTGVFMYTGLVTAVSSALIGSIWTLVNVRQTKKRLRQEELKRFESYGEYLIACTDKIKDKYEKNTENLKNLYVGSAVCCSYDHRCAQLWNRNRNHPDFIAQRLGMGSIPFQVKIEIPKKRFSMINDSLADKPEMIRNNYAWLKDVPVCLNFMEHKLIGLVGGGGKKGCYPVAYAMAAQIAANNCYTDVKMGFVYDGRHNEIDGGWEFARWFPHVWSEDRKARYVADSVQTASDAFFEIAKVLRVRAEEAQPASEGIFKPYYILFLEDASVLEGELISKFLLDDRQLGVTVVIMAEGIEGLPNSCEYIVENTDQYKGMYAVTDAKEDRIAIEYDQVSPVELEKFARRLSGIRVSEMETGGELPGMLTFFDMYGIHRLEELNVEDRWRKNRTYESIKGLIGQKAGGVPCYLDVHEKYHGPHGLVAGTTGSGKSETLQTYMLSLAINYGPDDVGFFLIDYKGGGMANLFSGLPHLMGQISNLSGNQVHRAMVSIKSENLRRQRIFKEYGVNNINHYTKLYKNKEAKIPVPHMFIIIDEFAELKREEPDFMKELISVAQVGRSLGVHMILATQKPNGTVDDNIWSNSKFRLCLRVQDRQDSNDMLHKPDAAYITQAGRCYLQVGNDELFELFQSGWSGAVYEEEEGSTQTDIAQMLSITGKAALVGSHMKVERKDRRKIQWITTLIQLLNEVGQEQEILESSGDSLQMEKLAYRFFEKLQERNVDYPESNYNLQRLQDFILVYGKVLKDKGSESTMEQAGAMLALAGNTGLKLPETKAKTQLDAVVEYLARIAEQNGYERQIQLWCPVLSTQLYLTQLEGFAENTFDGRKWPGMGNKWTLEAAVGLYDDPANRVQLPLTVDLAGNGHYAICGTVDSGKSTFLLTLLYSLVRRYTPQALNIYALDYSSKRLSAFEELAHVGGVLYESDEDKVGKFFTMMEGILEERKSLFRGGNYSQYVQAAGLEENGPTVPAILVAIDNYSNFRSKTNNIYDELMRKLAKEGVGYGIFLVITAAGFSVGEIPGRLGDNFKTVLCLEMIDKPAYCEALRTLHLEILPEQHVKGRGLAKVGDTVLEFQTALPFEADNDFERVSQIHQMCVRMNDCWQGKRARKIPLIPEKPIWTEFAQLEETIYMQKEGRKLPIGYDKKNASVYGIDLRRTYCYMISGKERTGKTNLLRIMALSAACMEGEVVIVDYAGELEAVAGQISARYITTDKGLYDYLVQLQTEFIKRNQFKKKCVAAGDTDEEVLDKMQHFYKIFILIDNLPEFVLHVEKPEEGVFSMDLFLKNLLEKGAMHNVYWFAGLNQDESRDVSSKSVYRLFIKDKRGIHFGGNVAEERLMDFEYIRFNERSLKVGPGIGMLPQSDDQSTRMVAVPLFRGAPYRNETLTEMTNKMFREERTE